LRQVPFGRRSTRFGATFRTGSPIQNRRSLVVRPEACVALIRMKVRFCKRVIAIDREPAMLVLVDEIDTGL
jgi:hypothetical protein